MPARANSGLTSALALACALSLTSCSQQSDPLLPESFFPDIPDLPQVGAVYASQGDGQALCAPVSVANALAWLEGDTDDESVVALTKLLASKDYMGTSFNAGTPLTGVIRGIDLYLKERGLPYHRLNYTGWQWVRPANRAEAPLSISWIVEGLTHRSAVWLNLGWYDSPFPGYYRRRGGHWVTLVGYKNGKLLVNDPGPWAGANINPQTLTGREIQPVLTKTAYRWLFPAMPLIALPELHTSKRRRAYIDGALILELH